MARQLDTLGLRYSFFRAIDGAKGEHLNFDSYDESACRRTGRRLLSPGERALAASHVALWRACLENDRPLLIAEDDLTFAPNFPETVRVVSDLMKTHRLVRLFGIFDRAYHSIADLGGAQLVRFLRGPLGTQCYALAPAGAKRLLAHLHPLTEPIDNYLDRFWTHDIPSLAILPYAVDHCSMEARASTLEPDRGKQHRSLGGKLRREFVRLRDDLERATYNAAWRP